MQKKIEKRSAAATQKRILTAAKKAFARKGLGGARVDEIALSANANKRMIYHYFGDKENLFLRVLEDAYIDIRQAEQSLELDSLPPKEALDKLVQFTWQYYISNPEFITLVNSENLHRARHLKKSKIIEHTNQQLTSLVEKLLERGVNEGVFREGIDPVQLNITIAAIGYYYLTNRYTGTIIYQRDLGSKESFEDRLKFNLKTIQRLVHK
ncbi:MAG: TetR family transcriptional regulator [Euryarchaeota archaeon]|jgi:AcrR family transcriptional regulator|nr:TetR family transcriptional regulator [Euryarchaeota archaeon]|tara:strand:- start:27 stop:656 length:630 start_codon:yes stop_codon:yes gene_type:complete